VDSRERRVVQHIVMFSGGVGSWATGRRVAERYGTKNLTVLFADTEMEDEDLYRFNDEAVPTIGGKFVKVGDGRTPWEIFFSVKFLGNSRIDPCSRILKRELMRQWLEDSYGPDECVVYLGFDWTEPQRLERARKHWIPYRVECPLMEPPLMDKRAQLKACEAAGIRIPRLYEMGFQHNNCGGFCIKAGQAAFKLLLEKMPERYAYHENKEQEFRRFIGKDVSILRHRGGAKKGQRMTLREFREKVVAEGKVDMTDWGACSCFAPPAGE
jgi:hypothetical protein